MSKIFILLITILGFGFHFSLVSGYGLINDKICDPGSRSPFPYTGIRFYKRNTFSLNSRKLSSNIHIAVCNKGRNSLALTDKISAKDINVNWNSTICIKTANKDQYILKSSLEAISQPFKRREGNKIFKIEKLVQLKDDGYNDVRAKEQLHGTIESLKDTNDFQESLLKSDISCFKIVRNKKYHSREIPIFKPYSFIGGIFQCHVPPSIYSQLSQEFLHKSSSSKSVVLDVLQVENFNCNINYPVAPLYSENLYHQWMILKVIPKWKSKVFLVPQASLQYTIPFLYTPNDANFFLHSKKLFKNAMNYERDNKGKKWYHKIDINEEYSASDGKGSVGIFSKSVSFALNKLNDMAKSKDNSEKNIQEEALIASMVSQFYSSVDDTDEYLNRENDGAGQDFHKRAITSHNHSYLETDDGFTTKVEEKFAQLDSIDKEYEQTWGQISRNGDDIMDERVNGNNQLTTSGTNDNNDDASYNEKSITEKRAADGNSFKHSIINREAFLTFYRELDLAEKFILLVFGLKKRKIFGVDLMGVCRDFFNK
ncbi:hypothetical protein DASC09_042830 [Saccharomycopsis crataegensis]|uniref:Uncharacterized protein n=1 Tax=Saccharomycopsis crataegensis TaxID=43959 RepID=A0AAV5QS26_9ASCO|nr:hypothetical protein DASC09_042830 [Saccharomycopsis crataegensis]